MNRSGLAFLLLGLTATAAANAQAPADLSTLSSAISHSDVRYRQTEIPAGQEVVLVDIAGPAKLTYWYITDDSGGKFVPGLVLKVYWDDATEPSINVPVGDFFGALKGQTADYTSSVLQINHLSYMCYLPMPFAKRARFVLANDGDKTYKGNMACGFDWEADPQYASNPSRLHCSWRRSNPVRDGAPSVAHLIDPGRVGGKNTFNTRHTILDVKGRGHYIGGFLQVDTHSKQWWGEGVTFFSVDGRIDPHSAGTEDEYGSCWGFGGLFTSPYCGLLLDSEGRHRMYRWYVVNPVRYKESLKVEIQSINSPPSGPFEAGADEMTSVAFWYQDGAQATALQPYEERTAPSQAVEYTKRAP